MWLKGMWKSALSWISRHMSLCVILWDGIWAVVIGKILNGNQYYDQTRDICVNACVWTCQIKLENADLIEAQLINFLISRNTALRVRILPGQMVSFELAKPVATEPLVIRMSRPFAANRLLTGSWKVFLTWCWTGIYTRFGLIYMGWFVASD